MGLTKIKTGGLTDNSVTDAKVADAITVTGAQTGITQVGTLTAGVWQGTKVASAYLDDDTAHLSGSAFTGTISSSTTSTTDSALTLTDAGVADYKFTFPDTSTIRLSTSTSSTKVFDLSNAGSGKMKLSVDGGLKPITGSDYSLVLESTNELNFYNADGYADSNRATLHINYSGTGSSVDLANSELVVTKGTGSTFAGNITQSADANLRHTITAGGSGEASLVLTANNTTGDSFVRWETNANTFCLGLDNSDGNKFILSAGSDPHSNSVINIQPDGSSIAVDKPISFGGVVQLLDVAQSIDFIQSGAINFDSNGDQTGRVLTIGSNRAAGSSGGTTNVVFNEDGSTNFHDDVSFNRRIVQNGLNVYVKDTDVASSSGSTFTILRSWHDTANWGQGMYLVEVFQYYPYASAHDYASWNCTYGYSGGTTVVEQIANTGSINAPAWTGETTISGNLKMRNLEISIAAYHYVKIRVTTPDTYTDNADNNNNNTVHIYP
jgi:hypothetical protein